MQLSVCPLQNVQPLSTRQQAAIRQVLAVFAPTIFLVPVTVRPLLDLSCIAIDKGTHECNP